MTDVATGSDDGDEGEPYTMERLIEVAQQLPFLYFEAFTCEKCKAPAFMAHLGLETLVCSNCGQARASKTPRPSMPGDLRPEHYETAVRELKNWWVAKNENPITEAEAKTLTPDVNALLTRMSAQTAMLMLKKVIEVAERLADLCRD